MLNFWIPNQLQSAFFTGNTIKFFFRPYEVIAVATEKGISIWHLSLNVEVDGRLSAEKVASLSGHEGEVGTPSL